MRLAASGSLRSHGIVELDHVGAGGCEVVHLRVHRRGEVHHHLVGVLIELVLRLLRHGEGAGQGDLRLALGVAPQERHVGDLDRLPRRWILPTTRGTSDRAARPVGDGGGVVVVDALERGGEAVGVALAAHLAVGDDVDAGALHVADRQQRRVVLRLLQIRLGDAPQLAQRARAAPSSFSMARSTSQSGCG